MERTSQTVMSPARSSAPMSARIAVRSARVSDAIARARAKTLLGGCDRPLDDHDSRPHPLLRDRFRLGCLATTRRRELFVAQHRERVEREPHIGCRAGKLVPPERIGERAHRLDLMVHAVAAGRTRDEEESGFGGAQVIGSLAQFPDEERRGEGAVAQLERRAVYALERAQRDDERDREDERHEDGADREASAQRERGPQQRLPPLAMRHILRRGRGLALHSAPARPTRSVNVIPVSLDC